MKHSNVYSSVNRIAPILFALAALLWWGLANKYLLYYQEQFQLFQFTFDYLKSRCLVPGGISFYIADFLTQFYYYPWIGAAIIALLLVIIRQLVFRLGRLLKADATYGLLSFLPSIAFWAFLCDENALSGLLIGTIFSLAACCIYMRFPGNLTNRVICILVSLPVLYVVAGSVYFLFIAWAVIYEFREAMRRKEVAHALLRLGLLVLAGILIPLLAQLVTQYAFAGLLSGIGYYRFPQLYTFTGLAAVALCVATPWLMRGFSLLKSPEKRGFILTLTAVAGIGFVWIYKAADPMKEEIMRYDYLTKTGQWNAVIAEAEKKSPTSPLSVACLNLALAKNNQLGDRMFEFYQNGPEGLIPSFKRDFYAPLVSNEIYYQLGMINTAQRFTFEAMEAIPDYRKSSRAFRRLAETNLINGQYKVAEKYLRALQHTLFHKKWADTMLKYAGNESAIAGNPEMARLRKSRYINDFLYSDTEMEDMLGLLLAQNPENRLAFEYLLGYTLQNKDLERFMTYYPLGRTMNYTHIPKSYQEALIYMWTQQNPNFNGLPWSISRNVLDGVSEFAHIYMKQKQPEAILKEKYGKTYWYYLLFV